VAPPAICDGRKKKPKKTDTPTTKTAGKIKMPKTVHQRGRKERRVKRNLRNHRQAKLRTNNPPYLKQIRGGERTRTENFKKKKNARTGTRVKTPGPKKKPFWAPKGHTRWGRNKDPRDRKKTNGKRVSGFQNNRHNLSRKPSREQDPERL